MNWIRTVLYLVSMDWIRTELYLLYSTNIYHHIIHRDNQGINNQIDRKEGEEVKAESATANSLRPILHGLRESHFLQVSLMDLSTRTWSRRETFSLLARHGRVDADAPQQHLTSS
jgi:hypothetical protein